MCVCVCKKGQRSTQIISVCLGVCVWVVFALTLKPGLVSLPLVSYHTERMRGLYVCFAFFCQVVGLAKCFFFGHKLLLAVTECVLCAVSVHLDLLLHHIVVPHHHHYYCGVALRPHTAHTGPPSISAALREGADGKFL